MSTPKKTTESGGGILPLLLLPWPETFRRLPRVVLGLVIFGVGIAMMVLADLGLGPWDVFHQGLADLTGIGIGTVIVGVGFLVLALFIPLRERMGVGTVLNTVLIGVTVDVVLAVLSAPESMLARALLMGFGPVLVALGSGLYIGGGLGPGPRDGVMTAMIDRGVKTWHARTAIEVTVLIAGVALGGTVGVGTIWFAVGIGPMVGWFLPRAEMSDL